MEAHGVPISGGIYSTCEVTESDKSDRISLGITGYLDQHTTTANQQTGHPPLTQQGPAMQRTAAWML